MMMCCWIVTGFLPMPWRYRDFQPLSTLVVAFYRVGTTSHRHGFGENVLRCSTAFWSGMIMEPRHVFMHATRNHPSARALRFGEVCSRRCRGSVAIWAAEGLRGG